MEPYYRIAEILACLIFLEIALGLMAFGYLDGVETNYPRLALGFGALASISPLITLVVFAWVAWLGQSANPWQTEHLDLWFDNWLWFFLGNVGSILLALIAIIIDPFPHKRTFSFAGRTVALVSAFIGYFLVAELMPSP